MGAVGGGIWHLVKGTKNSPSGQRFRGGLEVRPSGILADAHHLQLPRINPVIEYLIAA